MSLGPISDMFGGGGGGLYMTLYCRASSYVLSFISVWEEKLFLPFFSFFQVYEYRVLFLSFYSCYLDYKHKVLYPLIVAYTYRRTNITFLGCHKNIKNRLKFKTNSIFVFYVNNWVRIYIPMGLQLVEQQQQQLLKFLLLQIFYCSVLSLISK